MSHRNGLITFQIAMNGAAAGTLAGIWFCPFDGHAALPAFLTWLISTVHLFLLYTDK